MCGSEQPDCKKKERDICFHFSLSRDIGENKDTKVSLGFHKEKSRGCSDIITGRVLLSQAVDSGLITSTPYGPLSPAKNPPEPRVSPENSSV